MEQRRNHFLFLIPAFFTACDLGIHPVVSPPLPTPSSCSAGAAFFGGGGGTASDPYKICTRAHLESLTGIYLDKYFIQESDIDLGGSSNPFTPIATGALFSGVYDGNGKTITGFYYRQTGGGSRVGLFSNVGSLTLGGTIKNLTVSGADIDTEEAEAGVLVGLSAHLVVQNCHVSGTIRGDAYVGGLVGKADLGTAISFSSANVTVTSTDFGGSGFPYSGGLVGGLDATSSVTRSYALGAVTGINSGTGGLIGYSDGTISDSYAQGSATAASEVGGLVGDAGSSTITKCYSTGAVNIAGGGMVGFNGGGATASNSYWDTVTSGQAASVLGTGRTTAQMKDYTNFLTWDFASIWNGAAYPGSGAVYPFLR